MDNINRPLFFKFILAFIITILLIWLLSSSAIPQPVWYHQFADQRTLLSIPNFLNVVTNIAFIIVGVVGVIKLAKSRLCVATSLIPVFYLLFISASLIGAGSAYYHLDPDNASLVWDRLAMSLFFMTLFSLIISEVVSEKIGRQLLVPLLVVGLVSTIYWGYTESTGQGDLRLYLLVQYLPVILTPVILLSFKSRYSSVNGYWMILLVYALAKIAEVLDEQIFLATGFISGHSFKHLIAALSIYVLIRYYQKRCVVTN